jgi:hypothetical protein
MFKNLSRSSSQTSLNEIERTVSPAPRMRNTEQPSSSAMEQILTEELDPALLESIQFTKCHPIGAILVKLASDNTALAKKANLRGVETNINDLCTSFHTAMQIEKEQRLDELSTAHEDIEHAIIHKDLNSHKLNTSVHPPHYFSETPKITSAAKSAEIQKLFPHNFKFSGSKTDHMSVVEFLHILTTAQEQMHLTEKEFINRMILCSTGLAHELLTEWKANGENVDSIYHNLLVNFDRRLSPNEAKNQLQSYKVSKNTSLAAAESKIMLLAGRAAALYPEGPSSTSIYNMESCNTMINSLPRSSQAMVSNLFYQISARLGRAATFAELSKAMNLYRPTIDEDIRSHGGENFLRTRRAPQANIRGRSRPKYTSFVVTTNQPRNQVAMNRYGVAQARKLARAGATMKLGNSYNNSTSFTPKPLKLQTYNTNKFGKQHHNAHKNHGHGHHNNNNSHARPMLKRDSNGKFIRSNQNCLLCGTAGHNASSCRIMRDDNGEVVQMIPPHGTCTKCPARIRPRLHHPEKYCPYRPTGPWAHKANSA